MRQYNCEVIQDLLALYKDEVCSETSKNIVSEHLLECKECRNYLYELNREIAYDFNKMDNDAKNIKSIKRKILKLNIIVSVISSICMLLIACGITHYILNHESKIAYEELGISVEQDYDTLYFGFTGTPIYLTHTIQDIKTKDSGEKYIEVNLFCTQTPYTKIKTNSNERDLIYEIKDYDKEIPVRVYYEDTESNFKHLIWESNN